MRFAPLFALLLLLLSPAAPAKGDISQCRFGEVGALYGSVKIVRAGSTHVPVSGEPLCVGDRFMTDARGVAELKFADGTRITVGKDSTFVIRQWKQRRFRANQASFELVRGAFRALTGAITERDHRFEVKTSIATIGVRGTEFWGGLDLTPGAVDVIMLNGKGVYVTNSAGTVDISTPGTGVSVRSTAAPEAAKPWSPEKLRKAVATVTAN
jgi:hypothetical protein